MEAPRVVVVEDDPLVLFVAVSALETAGIDVVSFANADDALGHLMEHAAEVTAVLTDLQMPGRMDGLVLAEIVGRHWPSLTVVLTSGRVRPMGELPPNVRFIPKPWSPAELVDALQAGALHR